MDMVQLGILLLAAAPAFGQGQASPFDLDRIRVGQPAPEFRLPSSGGRTVAISEFRGKPVVLVFYRGSW
jgi:hypothetical protein